MARSLAPLRLGGVLPPVLAVVFASALARAGAVCETSPIRPEIVSSGTFDYCLHDSTTGSSLQFSSTTGAYVFCAGDGTFEEGRGAITIANGVVTLSHRFFSSTFNGAESVHATVDGAGHGQASLFGRNEAGTISRTIDDAHVNGGECGSCVARNAVREGVVNSVVEPTNSVGLGNSVADVTLLQQYDLGPAFHGRLTKLTAGIGRSGAGSLSFQFTAYSDFNGQPGNAIYLGPTLRFATFPALPTIGIVHDDVSIEAPSKLWLGIRWHPNTDPLYVPFATNLDLPLSKVYVCEPGHACNPLTSTPDFDNVRGLYLSADFDYPGLYASAGLVRYGMGDASDLLDYKCGESYQQIGLTPVGMSLLYAENPDATRIPNVTLSNAFARITPIGPPGGTGLAGVATTMYSGTRFAGFSVVQGSQLKFCTKPDDATDFLCHVVPGFNPGDCGYSRIAGVTGGFEISCANAPKDWISRWKLQYDGSGWSSQTLNPIKATPSIGSPEFGFPWYAAQSLKLGVAYEYETTAGLVQAQLVNGNSVLGAFTVDTDNPPSSFDPSHATRMAGDCTRSGWCIFGRYDARTQSNVADSIDFSQPTPEIVSWVLGPSPAGFQFGRAVSINARDGTALYSGYTPSSIANQYKLQLDYVDLKSYARFSISYDFGAGNGKFPLSLSREGADWGLSHAKGIDTFYSLTAGCNPVRIRGGHDIGSGPADPPGTPCLNLQLVGPRF